MQNIKFPVATPTPHYDYTVKYNHHIQELKDKHNIDHIKANQNKWAEHYDIKRKHVEEAHRIEKALQRNHELERIHQYEVLSHRHSYNEYRYMFYVGTKFDTYI